MQKPRNRMMLMISVQIMPFVDRCSLLLPEPVSPDIIFVAVSLPRTQVTENADRVARKNMRPSAVFIFTRTRPSALALPPSSPLLLLFFLPSCCCRLICTAAQRARGARRIIFERVLRLRKRSIKSQLGNRLCTLLGFLGASFELANDVKLL